MVTEKKQGGLKDMRVWSQFLGALSAGLNGATMGSYVSYSSVLIPAMQAEEGPLHMDLKEAAWIPTLLVLGSSCSALLFGGISARFGRRFTILCTALPLSLGWLAVYFATSKAWIFGSRFLMGILTGRNFSQVGIYISETVHKSVRNRLGVLCSVCISFAITCIFTWGYFFDYKRVALLAMTFPLMATLTMTFLPETAFWLVEKGRGEEARKSLRFYRGPYYDIEAELKEILAKNEEKLKMTTDGSMSWAFVLKRIFSKAFLEPFYSAGVLYCISQFSGVATLTVYMTNIFQDSGSSMDPKLAPIFVGIIRIVGAIMSSFIIHKVQKKYVFVTCSAILSLCMSTLATFSYFRTNYPQHQLSQLDWLPLVAAVVGMMGHTTGVITILHILISEVFPAEIRSIAVGLAHGLHSFFNMSNVKLYPYLLSQLEFSGVFYLYSGVGAAMSLWAALTMKRSDGLSLTQVESLYKKREPQENDSEERNKDAAA